MVRFGISMDEQLLEKFDALIARQGYTNRSEAIRDIIRDRLVTDEWQRDDQEVCGTITLVYDHHVRGLSDALTDLQHDYHHLFVSTLHIHMDEHNCLEVLVIRGRAAEARDIAQRLISIKGVKHGKLTLASTGNELV
ncbi:MAG: nickel-responsive transcriptional regulator NikR [Bacillota bacterium]